MPGWCREQGSNLHAFRHTVLSRARLPIPPSRLCLGWFHIRLVQLIQQQHSLDLRLHIGMDVALRDGNAGVTSKPLSGESIGTHLAQTGAECVQRRMQDAFLPEV